MQLAPNSPAAHRVLAQSLQTLGQKEKAAAELRASQALAPEKGVRDAHIVRMHAHNVEAVPAGNRAIGRSGRGKSQSFDELSREGRSSRGRRKH